MPSPTNRPKKNARWRGPLTVCGTLVVVLVLVEFLLLTAMYQRGAPAHGRQLVTASLAGEWRNVNAADLRTARADTALGLSRLAQLGVPKHDLAGISSAASQVRVSERVVVGRQAVTDAVAQLSRRLASDKRLIDIEAELIYAGLLIAASIGWMVWFRRLVARHRDLERKVTEQQSRAEGEQRLAALVRNAADVVAVCDLDSGVRFVTASVQTVLGAGPDSLVGATLNELVDAADQDAFQRLVSTVPTARIRRSRSVCVIRTAGSCTSRRP